MTDSYYEWLIDTISGGSNALNSYSKLLNELFETDFTWTVKLDKNRAEDGLSLRGEFQREGLFDPSIEGKPCSVLEMMIALARRIDSGIMRGFGPDYSALDWFMHMVKNLGLEGQNDRKYDQFIVRRTVKNMLDRMYVSGQKGALFVLEKCSTFDPKKWHTMEIWMQMTAWLNENFIKI